VKILTVPFVENNIDKIKIKTSNKPKVAFICVHNSCRSQIAEAISKLIAKDIFESYSAGTEIKSNINPDAVRLVKQKYGVNIEKTQYNKLIKDIPEPDILITMGCNVVCPYIPCQYSEDWRLQDPTGKNDEEFLLVINKIENNIRDLMCKLQ